MDIAKIEHLVKELLLAIGENPDREGLRETPERAARMLSEMLAGIAYSNADIARMCDKKFPTTTNDPVVVRDIECFSLCEHHLALIYNMKITIAYVPRGYVLGLSKFSRIADMVCRRLQLQERVGEDIAEILGMILGVKDIAVVIKAEHACVASRGIAKQHVITTTSTMRGKFKKELKFDI